MTVGARLQLTTEGEIFYARARPILAALGEAEAEVAEAGATPRGLLRLYCGSTFGTHQLAPAIPRFQALHAEVEIDIDITISDQPLGAIQDGVALAIRVGPLDESSLVARNLSPKVRAMVDFLVAEFGSAPWRQGRG